MIDLHIHTNASSDGQHTPDEIFQMAKKIGIGAISFADHNSIASLEEGLRLSKIYSIEFIPAVEFNSLYNGEDIHILGYFIPFSSDEFCSFIEEMRQRKLIQAKQRVEKFKSLGFQLEWEDVYRLSRGGIPTGMTYLKALLMKEENRQHELLKPYINGPKAKSPYINFYKDFLKGDAIASVPFYFPSTFEVIRRLRDFGSIPVLAHPSDLPAGSVEEMIKAGLMGIEAASSHHTADQERRWRSFAQEHNLLFTAGSDFHGEMIKPGVRLGVSKEYTYDIIEALRKSSKNRW